MSHNITIEGGTSVRLPTAGKYCDRDIVITATGSGTAPEDLDAVLTEQETLIDELKELLRSKAAGGGGGSNNYAKFTAKPSSSTSFTIENPLGGIASMVSIKAISPTITSSRKIHECCLSWDIRLGAVKAYYSSGNVSYAMTGTEGTPNNGDFRVTDGLITVYRFNSSTTWDTTCEYEVEVYVEGGSGADPVIEPLEITENGTYTAPDGVDGYSPITVNVEASGSADTRFKDYFEGTMTEIDDDSITKLKAFAFRSATTLTSVRLPNVTSVGQSTFRECDALKTVDLPNLAGLTGTYFCQNCEALTQVNIPKVTGLSNYSFTNCGKLARLELGNVGSIGTGCFASGDALETLIIRKTNGICSLANVNALNNTKIQGGTGYIYVPATLVDSYKSASNWSTFASQFRAIEDYPEIAGGEA